jgi:hypothetical protein
MNNLLSLINAADKGAISETNSQRIDASLAFGLTPSLDLTGNPTVLLGPPAGGAFVLGQFWIDAALGLWRCTLAGTPGTWLQQFPAVVTANPAGATVGYLIARADQHGSRYYFDGAAWQAAP